MILQTQDTGFTSILHLQAATAVALFRNHLLLKMDFIRLSRGGRYPGTQQQQQQPQQHIKSSFIKHDNMNFDSHIGTRRWGIQEGKHHHQHQHVTHAHREDRLDGPHLVPYTSTSKEANKTHWCADHHLEKHFFKSSTYIHICLTQEILKHIKKITQIYFNSESLNVLHEQVTLYDAKAYTCYKMQFKYKNKFNSILT